MCEAKAMTSALLEGRLARFSFFLHAYPYEPEPLALLRSSKEIEQLLDSRSGETLFFFGLVRFSEELAAKIIAWLNAHSANALVVMDDSLAALDAFLASSAGRALLAQRRFHVRMRIPNASEEQFFREIAEAFIEKAPGVVSLRETALSRRAFAHCMEYALASVYDAVCYRGIVENSLSNMMQLGRGAVFHNWGRLFEGMPAVVCGAGPSLAMAYPFIERMRSSSLVLAGGSAIALLSDAGITPHLGVAVDPNYAEYERLQSAAHSTAPLLFLGRLHKAVLSEVQGTPIYMYSNAGGAFEAELAQALGVPTELSSGTMSMTVTSSCIEVALELGCNPIILVGVDLAYCNGSMYPGRLESTDRARDGEVIWESAQDGRVVETTAFWQQERDALDAIMRSASDAAFYALPGSGLDFPSVARRSEEELLKRCGAISCESDAIIQAAIEAHPATLQGVRQCVCEIAASLCRCRELVVELLDELSSSRRCRPLIDACIDGLSRQRAFSLLIERTITLFEKLEKKSAQNKDGEKAKWEKAQSLIDEYIDILKI